MGEDAMLIAGYEMYELSAGPGTRLRQELLWHQLEMV
jgi:hypothetical protein